MAYNPFRHFWLKTVAVGIATLLWFAVGGEKVVERSLRVPLELQNVPPELEIVGDTPSAVDVRVRGSSTALGRLTPGDVTAVLDVSATKPGQNLLHLMPDHVRVPFGVDVSYVGPATVQLEFERRVTKRVPVVPRIEGTPAPGYVVERISVDPTEVEVVGPESALRDLTQATTEQVPLRTSAGPVQATVVIGILNSAARLSTPRSALVTIDIQPVRSERTFGAVPVRLEHLRTGQRARSAPPNVSVTIRGNDDALASLKAGEIEAAVDLTGLGAGRYVLPVRVTSPQVFGVVRVEPAQVQITIR